MIRYAMAVLALTVVYALSLASVNPWDLAFGLLVSATLLFVARLRFGGGLGPAGELRDPENKPTLGATLLKVLAFFPFLAVVILDTIRGAGRVLLAVLGVKPPKQPGIVGVPLGERSPEGVAVSAFLAAFSPGTLLVRVDEVERVMWIHAIDAEDPEAVRRAQQEFYERHQRKVFP
ncbi:Na+/H+ antiporter subunit E [Rubrobacter indicoceani]|uniref:Na+/H+ antiporter subunit E n=1 Tax=Rubrobacter indicoceani TaxID=2051957 RepID=UPI000E5ACCCC|nr:Na+/H+ antiporter subunit E [Rubrobacter indicoceani]